MLGLFNTETWSSTTKTMDVTSGMMMTSIERAAIAELTVCLAADVAGAHRCHLYLAEAPR
jgi:hypothetical protein